MGTNMAFPSHMVVSSGDHNDSDLDIVVCFAFYDRIAFISCTETEERAVSSNQSTGYLQIRVCVTYGCCS